MRSVHRLTKSLLDILSTFPIASFHCGSRFPQIHLLHHCSPFSTPSSVAHMDCHATLKVRVVLDCALDTPLITMYLSA